MAKGIFFDLGGTLYSYSGRAETIVSLIEQLSRRLGIEGDIRETVGLYQEATKEADLYYAEQPFYLIRDYFETIYENFVRRVDRTKNADDYAWFSHLKQQTSMDAMQLKNDCLAVLDSLKAKNLYLSVVSNSDVDMLDYLMYKAELHDYVDHWTSSEAARSCKPDQRIFEVALNKAGLSPDQVIFVGDSMEQDILGAHQAGMTTVLISESDTDAPMHIGRETVDPHFHIKELTQLLDIID